MSRDPERELAERRPVALYRDQEGWMSRQDGSRSKVLRELVDRAMGTPTPTAVRETIVAVLVELEHRGTWLRGSPSELLQDLLAGESTATALVDDVVSRLRAREEPLSEAMISDLCSEARAAGDADMVEICQLAAAENADAKSRHEARACVAEAITSARAMDDAAPLVRVVAR